MPQSSVASSFASFTAVLVLASCAGRTDTSHDIVVADAASAQDAAAPRPDVVVIADVTTTPMEAASGDDDASSSPLDVHVPEDGPACATCASYGAVTPVGAISATLVELSGLAASRLHPGVFYAHNDSGDTPRFFAINDKAKLLAEMDLMGASAVDWEDAAVGPCPAGWCVYIGDIGDNAMARNEYAIYRVAEPPALATDGGKSNVAFERFPFVYPDGKHNAETLLAHPSGRVFVVTKVTGVAAGVYELSPPFTPGIQATLKRITAVSADPMNRELTGGTFHPCGDRLLLRTYTALYELVGAAGNLEQLFQAPPKSVPVATEAQGEAVSYSLDGKAYFTASETTGSPPAQLNRVGCP